MAHLDYALLAESARLEPGGTVSLLGGSFSRLLVPLTPAQVPLSVVARVLVDPTEGPVTLQIKIIGPDELFQVTLDTEVGARNEEVVEGVESAVTFAASLMLPIPTEGLYTIEAALTEGESRIMKFRVAMADPPVRGG